MASTTYSAELLKLISPTQYLSNLPPHTPRTLTLRTDILTDQPESTLARLGYSAVLAGVKLSVTQAHTGFLSVSVLPPLGWSKRDQTALAGLLQSTLLLAVDLGSLKISDSHVFHVELAFVILEDDGSVFDCCLAAGVSVLKHFRLPALTRELLVTDTSDEVYTAKPLTLKSLPLAVTALRVLGRLTLDCTKDQEAVAEGTVVFRQDAGGEIVVATWHGRVEPEEMELVMAQAKEVLTSRRIALGWQ